MFPSLSHSSINKYTTQKQCCYIMLICWYCCCRRYGEYGFSRISLFLCFYDYATMLALYIMCT
jgi:hypothetical protein